MKVVPLPSWLSNDTVPPNASVIRFTTGKPKPWPLALVVNIGVNILLFIASGMPMPVSFTVITTSSTSLHACIVSFPPFGIA